jgi:hypothetical protein
MITMSVRENVNGVQSIDTSVNATSSRCLKATKYSKNSMGDISSVTISVKKKRSCRGL